MRVFLPLKSGGWATATVTEDCPEDVIRALTALVEAAAELPPDYFAVDRKRLQVDVQHQQMTDY